LMEENLRLVRASGLLDPAGIAPLRKMFDAEPRGPAWSRVWALTVLGNWLRKKDSGPQDSRGTTLRAPAINTRFIGN
jgi:hypothetical protein